MDIDNDRIKEVKIPIENFIDQLRNDPEIFAIISKNNNDFSALKSIEETLCNSFFDNITMDGFDSKNFIKLVEKLLQVYLSSIL